MVTNEVMTEEEDVGAVVIGAPVTAATPGSAAVVVGTIAALEMA